MNTNDNKQITTEKFLFLLKQHIDFLESQYGGKMRYETI